jgi:hypothetical protein
LHYGLMLTCVAMMDRHECSQQFQVNLSECCTLLHRTRVHLGLNETLMAWPTLRRLGRIATIRSASLGMQDGARASLNSVLCGLKCPVSSQVFVVA